MLREITNARRVMGEPRRRWFYSPECDLIVWVDEGGAVLGFQFSYDKAEREHAFSWQSRSVADPDLDPPIHASDAAFDAARIARLFGSERGDVPNDYAELVVRKILERA